MMPLLVETLIPIVAAYLLGVGISWFFFGRPTRDSYL
jgi:hypothetical protein